MRVNYSFYLLVCVLSMQSCAVLKPAPVKVAAANSSPFFDNVVVKLGTPEREKTVDRPTIEKNIGPIEDKIEKNPSMNDSMG